MITQDQKEQIFAMYWGQRVLVRNIDNRQYKNKIVCTQSNWSGWVSVALLELKPLSSITDEDAIPCVKLISWRPNTGSKRHSLDNSVSQFDVNWFKSKECNKNIMPIQVTDYLRSRGYALPAFGHSVDELVKEGVFKLIED